RIDVVEVRKIRRILEIAEGREAVTLGCLREGRRAKFRRGNRAGGQQQGVAAGYHVRDRALAAFSSSHHQTVGNAAAPYFGMFAGWLSRSLRPVGTNG